MFLQEPGSYAFDDETAIKVPLGTSSAERKARSLNNPETGTRHLNQALCQRIDGRVPARLHEWQKLLGRVSERHHAATPFHHWPLDANHP